MADNIDCSHQIISYEIFLMIAVLCVLYQCNCEFPICTLSLLQAKYVACAIVVCDFFPLAFGHSVGDLCRAVVWLQQNVCFPLFARTRSLQECREGSIFARDVLLCGLSLCCLRLQICIKYAPLNHN